MPLDKTTATTPYNLAYFVSHPIQYQAPLLKLLSAQQDINLQVFFLSDLSTKGYVDEGFGTEVSWDVPLLDGYQHTFLESEFAAQGFSFTNPRVAKSSLKEALSSQTWHAVWIHGYANRAFIDILRHCFVRRVPLLLRGESNLTCTSSGFIKGLLVRGLVKMCSALLYIGTDNKNYYQHYGARQEKLFSVPYAVDNQFFQTESLAAKNAENWPAEMPVTNKKVILYASKFIQRKHPLLLLQAFAEIELSLRNKAELWFVGDGEQLAKMHDEISKAGLQDQVKLLGFKNQTELPAYFARCDLFVLPSEKEPFGLIINEVMNAGKAILTTDQVGAAADLVEHGVNGWVIPAGSKSALSTALEDALQQPQKLSVMGNQSLKIIAEWGFEENVKGIRQALQAVG